jgi:hypothetical protein
LTDNGHSPRLLAQQIKMHYYSLLNDDARQQGADAKLREAFEEAGFKAKNQHVESCYNEALVERAWNELVTLSKRVAV